MSNFLMPVLGADMEAGTVVAWRKRPGDAVHRGDTIVEVDTEKGVIDVEAFVDGVLDEIMVPVGKRVPVGTVMATIDERGALPAAARRAAVPAAPPETGEERPLAAAEMPPPQARGQAAMPTARYAPGLAEAERLRISPSARRLARERGVDPAGVAGTGRGHSITREDIERAAGTPRPAPAVDRLQRMRRTIAAAMSRSKREIPHYYLSTTIDLGRAVEFLRANNAPLPVGNRLLPGVLLLKAAALALRDVPELNAAWENDRVVLKDAVHVGVAISLRGGGLVILALHDTATRSLDDLMAGLRDLTARARAGRMKSSELSDSTITVTSLGDRGVESVFGVIYPPQVAIVGFGRIADRPRAVDGGLFVRPMVTATLAADHRVSDGHRGGLFLEAVDRLLQEPEKL
jgi:pyruvate dehydrogenase E2 component (dihydrolipoamide acetyltransferase)